MRTLIAEAALLAAGLGMLAILAGALATRRLLGGLPLGLDLFLAAGLLRLTTERTWEDVTAAVAIIVVRRLVGWALQGGPPTLQRRARAQERP